MLDITEIPSLFRIVVFRLVVALDVFSRMPLAARVSREEPTAEHVAELFEHVARRHAVPPHLVTDRGGQFIAAQFQNTVKTAGSKQRFGAVGKTGSIALIERLWRTVKELGAFRLWPPLTLEDCQRRVELTLLHYAYCRPHRALGGATPAEVYFGIRPEHLSAVTPPRGRPGEGDTEPPFEIVYLDPQQRLPLLLPRAA